MRAMTADDLLDSYVRELALHLPRARRQDIALELRALLAEELAAAPGGPDAEQALALLRRHGRPAQLAQRYHERAALIEPADTPLFLVWATVGALVLGLRVLLHGSAQGEGSLFLQWLGLLLQGGLGLLLIVHGQLLSLPGADGQVFLSLSANRVAAPIFLSVGALTLLAALYAGWRESLWVDLKPCQPQQRQENRA